MKVTYNGGYYAIKTATREAMYRADELTELLEHYKAKIKRAQRALKDLEAIEQYRKEQT